MEARTLFTTMNGRQGETAGMCDHTQAGACVLLPTPKAIYSTVTVEPLMK